MGYVESDVPHPVKPKTGVSMRRIFIPEPLPSQILNAFPPKPPVYQVGYCETAAPKRPKKKQCKQRVVTEYTHTSILTAIRNCVLRIQQPQHNGKHHHRRRQRTVHENCHALICSLKCDLNKISKFEEDMASNPENLNCGEAFLILPAMLCKLNKLEECLIKSAECDKQLARKKEMLITAKCIRKGLYDQLRCDERLLLDRKKKICCLIKSLQIFEKQIKCSTKAYTNKCQLYLEQNKTSADSCSCPDKSKCCGKCKENPDHCNTVCCPPPAPCLQPACNDKEAEPSGDCEDELTEMNIVYTKNNVEKDCEGGERTYLESQLCYDSKKSDDCQISIIKDGNMCDICNDPVLRGKINNASRVWMESARQLVEAAKCGNAC